MAKNFTICVGTLGMGLWRSTDGGQSWARGKLWKGYQGGRSIFGLAVHPPGSPDHLRGRRRWHLSKRRPRRDLRAHGIAAGRV